MSHNHRGPALRETYVGRGRAGVGRYNAARAPTRVSRVIMTQRTTTAEKAASAVPPRTHLLGSSPPSGEPARVIAQAMIWRLGHSQLGSMAGNGMGSSQAGAVPTPSTVVPSARSSMASGKREANRDLAQAS